MSCCRDDSSYDYTCDECEKPLDREQDLFLLTHVDTDKIFCSNKCKDKFQSENPEVDMPYRQTVELETTTV